MSIQYFNQSPVRFNANNHVLYGEEICEGERAPKFCQPVKITDTTSWQVKPCDFGVNNIINNGTFAIGFDWTLGTGWTINTTSNRAERLSGGGVGVMSQIVQELSDVSASNPKTFEIRFNVLSFDDNASTNDLIVKIGGTTVETINDLITGGPNQTYLVSVSLSATTDQLLSFEAEASVDVNIDNVSVTVAECTMPQKLLNPEFVTGIAGWTLGAGWSFSSQEATIAKASTGVMDQSLPSSIIPGKFIRLEYNIVGIDATSTGSMDVKIGGNVVVNHDETTTPGVFKFNFFLTSTTNTLVEFDAALLGVTIEYCTIYELSAPGYILETCDGTFVQDFTTADGTTNNVTSHVQFDHDWSTFSNDCYFFRAFDMNDTGSELIANGTITTPAAEWGFGTNWSEVASQGSFTGAFSGIPFLNQVIGILADKFYIVKYEIVTWVDSSGGADGSMDVTLGNVVIVNYVDATSVGQHVHLVSTAGLIAFDFRFAIINTTTNLNVVVDNVSVQELTSSESFCSECFQLNGWLDSKGCEITKEITATNVDNAFGFNYTDLTLVHFMRVKARLKREAYEQIEYDAFLFNNNSVTTNYAQYRETRTLLMDLHPSYVYNALQAMSDHDTFTIKSVEYNKITEGIAPDYAPGYLAASAEIVYFESSQPNRINDNC